MEGFVFGLAIFVTVSQLPKLFGLKKGPGDTIRQLVYVIAHLGDTSLTTLAVGAVAPVLLFALDRYLPRLPGGLVVLVLGIAISARLGLSSHGVDVVGKIPTGLPGVSVSHLKVAELWVLLPSAAGMMLVIFSEALGAGQTFADKHGYRPPTRSTGPGEVLRRGCWRPCHRYRFPPSRIADGAGLLVAAPLPQDSCSCLASQSPWLTQPGHGRSVWHHPIGHWPSAPPVKQRGGKLPGRWPLLGSPGRSAHACGPEGYAQGPCLPHGQRAPWRRAGPDLDYDACLTIGRPEAVVR